MAVDFYEAKKEVQKWRHIVDQLRENKRLEFHVHRRLQIQRDIHQAEGELRKAVQLMNTAKRGGS